MQKIHSQKQPFKKEGTQHFQYFMIGFHFVDWKIGIVPQEANCPEKSIDHEVVSKLQLLEIFGDNETTKLLPIKRIRGSEGSNQKVYYLNCRNGHSRPSRAMNRLIQCRQSEMAVCYNPNRKVFKWNARTHSRVAVSVQPTVTRNRSNM